MAITNKALEAMLGLSGGAHNLTRAEMLAARAARNEAAAQAAAKTSGRSSGGGAFNPMARTRHRGMVVPPTAGTARAIVNGRRGVAPTAAAATTAAKRKAFYKRHPALTMGGIGMAAGVGSLMRNTGPGATGNGYTGVGNSSGGRRGF